jgi:hypothetical protein
MKRITALFVLASAVTVSQIGCGGGSPSSPSTPSSGSTTTTTTTPNLGSSHNAGRDCTACHGFTIAGTAYKTDGTSVYAGATIRLSTGGAGSGSTVATLTSDASGNFRTSSAINFGTGLFATATGTSGAVRSMSMAVTHGACNACHESGKRIVVE